jgi:antitoxin component YwqK of YwqJK toxin-antitoxin module
VVQLDDQGRTVFEGEYKDNLKKGQGREYFTTGQKKFEGEYKDDKRHGRGVEYNKGGKVKCETTFDRGQIAGHTALYYDTGVPKFVGEYFESSKQGRGKIYYPNGQLSYEGDISENAVEGAGTKWDRNMVMKGEGYFEQGKLLIATYDIHAQKRLTDTQEADKEKDEKMERMFLKTMQLLQSANQNFDRAFQPTEDKLSKGSLLRTQPIIDRYFQQNLDV